MQPVKTFVYSLFLKIKIMLKLIFLYSFCVLFPISELYSQEEFYHEYNKKTLIDECNFIISYLYKFVNDTANKNFYYDKQRLEIGNKYSHYYSIYADRIDSVWYNFVNDKKQQRPNKDGSDGINPNKEAGLKDNEMGLYEDFYINYPSQGILTVSTGLFYIEYLYEEPVPKFEWKIQSDTTTILGYKCVKAITTFRGRDYEVWFTPFIPLYKGPWKFNGLPGLILKAADTKEYFEWTAIGIEKTSDKKIFKHEINKTNSINITRQELQKLQHKRWKDPVGLILANTKHLNAAFFIKNPKTGNHIMVQEGINIQYPYIPIPELE
jgi:GLPGLI family protein